MLQSGIGFRFEVVSSMISCSLTYASAYRISDFNMVRYWWHTVDAALSSARFRNRYSVEIVHGTCATLV